MRLPLYARILLWFLLNVAVIGVALGLVMRAQFRQGLDSFMGSLVSAKLQSTAEKMYQDLSATPVDQWDGIVRELESAYGVQASLTRLPGRHLGGTRLDVPDIVRNELAARMEHRRPPDRGNRPPPPPEFENEAGPPPPGFRDAPGPPLPGGPEGRGPDRPRPDDRGGAGAVPSQYAKLLLRAGDPERYWAIALLPPPSNLPGPRQPLTLVIATNSILTGGLLFDIRPWLIGIGAALGFSALLWLPLVRGITGKVNETMRATEQMAQGKFDVRVNENRSDELGRLAHAVNSMAQQLNGYVTGQRRFTGDIAHELCSPISRMQAALGILEIRATDEKQQRYVETLSEELQHMSHLVQELLQFSKASLHRDITLRPVPLAEIANEIAARESGGFPDNAVLVEIDDSLTVRAEPELLSRALGNVLRNALRYAGEDGPVMITAAPVENTVVVKVSDSGPGVPAEALPRLFDAFFRPDTARSREHGGAGLGLAIVKSCIEACEGKVTAQNRQPHGLEVTLTLPAA